MKTRYERTVTRNKDKDSEATYVLRWAKKLRAIRHLGGKCIKCGESSSYKLSFHHTGIKTEEINYLFSSKNDGRTSRVR